MKNTKPVIDERRHKLWVMLVKGMRSYDIAKELKCDHSTISRDIQYLTKQSQNYLESLAKETLPFMYMTSLEGIRDVLKECWNIYESTDEQVNYFQRLRSAQVSKRM